jgi:hypothetical protein
MLQILKRVTQIDNFEIGSHPKKYPLNDAYIYAFLIVSSHMYIYKLCHNADDGRLFVFTCLQRCDLGVVGRSINPVYNGGKLLGHQHQSVIWSWWTIINLFYLHPMCLIAKQWVKILVANNDVCKWKNVEKGVKGLPIEAILSPLDTACRAPALHHDWPRPCCSTGYVVLS